MADQETAVSERPKEHRENRKKNLGRKVEPNQARAVAKFVRVPPRKARLVIDEVRGRYAMDALAFLRFIPNRAAEYIRRVLESAVANAANNHNLNPDNLKLVGAHVDEGPRWKRVQPRAQGRAFRILKRTSHITVIVQEVEPKPRKPRKAAGRRAQAAREARQPQAAPPSAPVAATTPEVTTPAVAEDTEPITAVDATPEVLETAAKAQETAASQEPETARAEDKTNESSPPTRTDEA
jgi:large subunit ribosomal protein L22